MRTTSSARLSALFGMTERGLLGCDSPSCLQRHMSFQQLRRSDRSGAEEVLRMLDPLGNTTSPATQDLPHNASCPTKTPHTTHPGLGPRPGS